MDPNKIEERLDRVAAGNTEIQMDLGGVKFQTMLEVMEFSKLMSLSQSAVPPHLRNNPGACLAICTKALRFRFDPFALAEHSFAMSKEVEVTVESPQGGRSTQKQKVETIAYDSYVIRAIINSWAPIKGSILYTYAGEGDEKKCTVTVTRSDTGEVIQHTSPTLGQRKKDIGTSDKGYLKGSPLWNTKPDVQLGYDTARDLCRLHFPEVLMGWYDKDEFEEFAKAATATDVTPDNKPTISARLAGQANRQGFHPSNVQQIEDKHEQPMVIDVVEEGEKTPEPVEATAETTKKPHKQKKPGATRDSAGKDQETPPQTVPGKVPPKAPEEPVEEVSPGTSTAEGQPAEGDEEPEAEAEDGAEDSDGGADAEEPVAEVLPSDGFEAAGQKVEGLIAGASVVPDLKILKKEGRALIDGFSDLKDEERDTLRGRFTTALLEEEKRRASKPKKRH